mgnify:CR=1 FL=1
MVLVLCTVLRAPSDGCFVKLPRDLTQRKLSKKDVPFYVPLLLCMCRVSVASRKKEASSTYSFPNSQQTLPPILTGAPYETSRFPPDGLPVHTTDDHQLGRRLGAVKFSDVFEAICVNQQSAHYDSVVVLKVLKPVSERKIRREVWMLQQVANLPHLAQLYAIVVPKEETDSDQNGSRSSRLKLPRMPSLVLQHAGRSSQWLCHPATATGQSRLL